MKQDCMNEVFFPELIRRLRREDIATGPMDGGRLPVMLEGEAAMWIDPRGTIFLQAKYAHEQPCRQLYDRVAGISAQVLEYTTAVSEAPRLKAEGLRENFRLLADFNGVVLAGRKMEGGLGYEFTTWRHTADRTGVTQGNYYSDYDGAKLDFACRSGLVQESRQFSDEQLAEMYCSIQETLDSEYPLTRERRDTLTVAASQIERSVDDLDERVRLSNQQELEAAEQQNGSPGLEMAP